MSDVDVPAAEVLARRYAGEGAVESSYGQDTVDVPRSFWTAALTSARDELGFTFFDWLTAVDQLDAAEEPGFDVVCHLWSLPRRQHLLLRTRVPVADPVLDTATGVFAGAAWHERETFEMFGVDFAGHPHLVPLLLPDGFEGHPLRKDFPQTGYVEVRYDDEKKRVVYEPVRLTQEFRSFDFESPWEGADYVLPGDEKAAINPPAGKA